jgi:hypothetical protein
MSQAYVTGIPVIGRLSNRPSERRRSSRYRCSGLAEVLRIPTIGTTVKAMVSDLSLHGCRILTEFSFESGVPLDLLLRVKSISFRASGHVKVVRGPAEIGIEFTHMSTGGERRLTELLAELDRISSLPGRKRQAPQVIEGECHPQDAETFTLPMRPTGAHHVPQPQSVRRLRFLLPQTQEIDVFL